MKTPENSGQMQAGQFRPGQSGNPMGKPPGTLNRSTQAVQALLEGETEALTRKAIELALQGDMVALRLCLDRIAPPPKPAARPIMLDGPMPNSLTGIARELVAGAAQGNIPPDIAATLISAIANVAKVEEMEQLKARMESLERALKGRKP